MEEVTHGVTDEQTGLSIVEEPGCGVAVKGLENYLPLDVLASLQTLLDLWKYGLRPDVEAA